MALMICGKKGAYLVNLSKVEMELVSAAISYLSQDEPFAKFAKRHYGLYALGDLHYAMQALVETLAQKKQQAEKDPFMCDLATAFKDATAREITANGEPYSRYLEKGASKADMEKAKVLGEKLAKGLIRPDGTEVKLRTKAEEEAEEAAKKGKKTEEPSIPFEVPSVVHMDDYEPEPDWEE